MRGGEAAQLRTAVVDTGTERRRRDRRPGREATSSLMDAEAERCSLAAERGRRRGGQDGGVELIIEAAEGDSTGEAVK